MFSGETLSALLKDDKAVQKQVFEILFSKLAGICNRYSKSQAQANEVLNVAFNNCLHKLFKQRQTDNFDLEKFFETNTILECVDFVRAVRSEYYVSSTVYATTSVEKTFDLFEDNRYIDVNNANNEVLIKSLQQMVPSQRLIFNLHVIDGYSLSEAAQIVDASQETAKSNLEKARFNLQKNIEKNIKSIKNEQPL